LFCRHPWGPLNWACIVNLDARPTLSRGCRRARKDDLKDRRKSHVRIPPRKHCHRWERSQALSDLADVWCGTPLTGDVGSIVGTMLAVLIITLLSNGMNLTGVDPFLQNIVKGTVMICAVFAAIYRKRLGLIR
jgi:hypothetical protein